jgi:hypothetical protein
MFRPFQPSITDDQVRAISKAMDREESVAIVAAAMGYDPPPKDEPPPQRGTTAAAPAKGKASRSRTTGQSRTSGSSNSG